MKRCLILCLCTLAIAFAQDKGNATKAKGNNLIRPLAELEKDLKGKLEKIKVHGKSLEGNLEGDSPDRDVFVYLPPSYATNTNRRYPVLYFLHGYGVKAETYWNLMTVPDATDAAIADGSAREMILVNPD